eukprot:6303289-Alexandrium_andersonii.AAC.1
MLRGNGGASSASRSMPTDGVRDLSRRRSAIAPRGAGPLVGRGASWELLAAAPAGAAGRRSR